MVEIFNHKPQNKYEFMLEYLEKRYGERATMGDQTKLFFLRNEAERLE